MKKKILFVNHNSDYGGATDEYERLLKYFNRFRNEYYICGLFPEGLIAANFTQYCDEWNTYSLGFFPVTPGNLSHYYYYLKLYFVQKREINKILKGKNYDLCILNVVVMLWISIFLKKKKFKSLVFIREKLEPKFIRKVYYRIISKLSDYFIAVSDSLEKDFIEITNNKNSKTLYSSIEEKLDYSNHSSFLIKVSELGLKKVISGEHTTFINVASISDRKNQIMIVKACKILKKRNSKNNLPYFIFMGSISDDQYHKKLVGLIEKEDLADNCFLLAHQDKNFLYNVLNYVSGMIISSKSEGLPLVLAEALRFKIPLITTAVGGIGDVIIDHYNGLLIKNDENSLAMAIEEIISNSNISKTLVQNGFETYQKLFNLEKNFEEIKKLSDEIINCP